MAASDARPFAIKGQAYRVYFPILDADGDLISGAAGLDSEISKDGGTFTDCTNEATEIATSSGVYYLELSSAEMSADAVCVIVKTSTSGAKTTPIVLYPVEGGDIDVDVTYINGAAVSTSTAQLGVNAVQAGGTAWASGAITAASIATNAIDADALAADAVTEIQSGLATSSALSTVSGLVDDLEGRLTATRAGYLDNLNSGVGLTSAAIDALWDEALEGSLTARQIVRILLAALAGESNGGGTSTINFRDNADSKNRISATVDSNRNRTAVTLDGS